MKTEFDLNALWCLYNIFFQHENIRVIIVTTMAGLTKNVSTTSCVTRYVLLLFCSCAAVNILLYSLAFSPMGKSDLVVNVDVRNELVYESPQSPNDLQRRGLRQVHKHSEYNDHDKHSSYDQRIFMFPVNNYTTCQKNQSDSDWDLVIVVISKATNFIQRNVIRNTWGSELGVLNTKIVFLLGMVENNDINKQVRKESDLYNDIIQVDLEDIYGHLTYKSIAMLQWLADYCHISRYFLKVDDDIYVNVENLISGLKQIQQERFFFCHVFKEAPPIRQVSSKWYISVNEFNKEFFPTYCSGTAYAFSSSILGNLHQSAMQGPLVSLEDVYITGIAAENIKVTHVHSGKFSFVKEKPTGCTYEKLYSGHEVTIEQMYIIHSQIKSKEIDCDTNQNKYLLKVENE